MTLTEQQLLGLMKAIAPKTSDDQLNKFVPHFSTLLPLYNIDSGERLAAFFATVAFESMGFKRTKEVRIGTPRNEKQAKAKAYQDKYWNTGFYGRGLIQVTKKPNYVAFDNWFNTPKGESVLQIADTLPVDQLGGDWRFDRYPELLERPFWAVASAFWFWDVNELNKYADIHDFSAIQGVVNRGNPDKVALDYNSRLTLYLKAIAFLADLTPAAIPRPVTPLPTSVDDKSESPVTDGTSPSNPPIFHNDVDSGPITPAVPKKSFGDRLKEWYASFVSYFNTTNQVINDNVQRKDAAKSTYALIGGGLKQVLWALFAFFEGVPKELYITVAIIVGVLTIIYLIRQVWLGVIREKKG